MYDAIRYATAVYRNGLARRVQGIGYQTIPAKYGFEIKGVSETILRRFSKRAQQRDKVTQEMEQKLGRKLPTTKWLLPCIRAGPESSRASQQQKFASAKSPSYPMKNFNLCGHFPRRQPLKPCRLRSARRKR
jgi:hypothetical protein